MTPQHLSVGAAVVLLAVAPAIPGSVLFLVACYGIGAILGQVIAFLLGMRYPQVKEGRVAAAGGLLGLLVGLAILVLGGVS